jgi:hypothetical protein
MRKAPINASPAMARGRRERLRHTSDQAMSILSGKIFRRRSLTFIFSRSQDRHTLLKGGLLSVVGFADKGAGPDGLKTARSCNAAIYASTSIRALSPPLSRFLSIHVASMLARDGTGNA